MSTEKTPAKRKSNGRVPQAYGTIDPEFSQKVLMWNIELLKYRADKPKTVEELQETVEAYFQICSKYKLIPTVEGLSIITHYDMNSLNDICNGLFKTDFTVIVKEAKSIIKNYDAAMATNGMIPSSVYQFRAKNFYGMKDVQEVTVAPKTDLEPENVKDILEEIPDQLAGGNTGNK